LNNSQDNHQPESAAALSELENIDTQADKMNIAFVKINDLVLVDEYGLSQLPAIVYFRQSIPIPYEGDSFAFKIKRNIY
jgi:hypothetical protein